MVLKFVGVNSFTYQLLCYFCQARSHDMSTMKGLRGGSNNNHYNIHIKKKYIVPLIRRWLEIEFTTFQVLICALSSITEYIILIYCNILSNMSVLYNMSVV